MLEIISITTFFLIIVLLSILDIHTVCSFSSTTSIKRPALLRVVLLDSRPAIRPTTNSVFMSSSSSSSSSKQECDIEEVTNVFVKRGQPSFPGWKNVSQFDTLTEWATCDEANRPVICEYDPDAWWLWSRWRGTALSITYIPVILTLCLGIGVDRYAHYASDWSWSFFAVPPQDDPIIMQLVGMKVVWEYQLTLCTFILAFFTSQSYSFWRSVYFTTRAIQGRINDICLLISASAERECINDDDNDDNNNNDTKRKKNDSTSTGYSEQASELVKTCARLVRLSHTFFWASTPTLSNGLGDGGVLDGDDQQDILSRIEIGPILLSPEGLRRLQQVDELTKNEVDALLASGLPPSQYTYILLEWVALYALEGLKDGILIGGNGLEENLLRQITSLRAEYFTIGDYVSGM